MRDDLEFLHRVTNDAMAPKYVAGDFAVVDPTEAPLPGDDVLVRMADGRLVLRRLLALHDATGDLALGTLRPGEPPELVPARDVAAVLYVAHPVPTKRLPVLAAAGIVERAPVAL